MTLFLRRVLAFDAITCTAMGLLLIVAAGPLATLLALPQPLLFEAGLFLLPFALFLIWAMKRGAAWPVQLAAAINLLWVAASFGLLAGPWVSPNLLGTLFVGAQAVAVAGIAALQLLGLTRTRAAA